MIVHYLTLVFGVFACSTAVIFIKSCSVHPVLLASYRLFVAAVALTPMLWRDVRRSGRPLSSSDLRTALVPGVLLGLHFISWIIGARMTPAVNASLIVNLVPIVMPLVLIPVARERITRREVVGTVTATAGLLLLSGGDLNVSLQHFWGDVTCFVSMLFFTCYLALARRNRHVASVFVYLVPLYTVAGVFCLLVALFFVNPLTQTYSLREVRLVIGLGLIPTVFGHSILNYAMKHLRGQVVAIVNMGQFIFAGTMAYMRFGEVPSLFFYPSCALVVGSACFVISGQARAQLRK